MKVRQAAVSFGCEWMYRLLIFLLKKIHIKVFYYIMSIFIIPITLIFSPGARLTYHYFHNRRNYGITKSIWSTYRNHCIFGQTVIDKFAMYAGHQFQVKYHGLELYEEMTSSNSPLLQLSAHIGCSEILGYSLHVSKICNVLVYGGENQSLMDYRKKSFEKMNINMIPVGTESSNSEEIVDAIDRSEIICSFADRFMDTKRVIESSIHGNKVYLAKGMFSLATTKGIDVIMASALKEPDGSYSAYFTPLQYDKTLPKSQQRQQLADAYTAEIERLLNLYPLQWFNYFNLWIN